MAGIGFENAPNYKVYPGSFIGRQMAFYKVGHVDLNAGGLNDPALDNVNFRLAIQTIQQHAEIMFIGNPTVSNSYAQFIVAIAQDTANDGNDTIGNIKNNDLAETIEAALRNVDALNGSSNATFERRWVFGSAFQSTNEYLTSITESWQNNTLDAPETFAPGSVEQNELEYLQSL